MWWVCLANPVMIPWLSHALWPPSSCGGSCSAALAMVVWGQLDRQGGQKGREQYLIYCMPYILFILYSFIIPVLVS